jgi:folate-binding Fe-S cluster repair protein YgfZ
MPDLLLAPAPPSVPVSEPVVCAHVASALLEVTGDEAIAFLQGQL